MTTDSDITDIADLRRAGLGLTSEQRRIYELAGFLSSQSAFATRHPEELIPMAEAIIAFQTRPRRKGRKAR